MEFFLRKTPRHYGNINNNNSWYDRFISLAVLNLSKTAFKIDSEARKIKYMTSTKFEVLLPSFQCLALACLFVDGSPIACPTEASAMYKQIN